MDHFRQKGGPKKKLPHVTIPVTFFWVYLEAGHVGDKWQ
jgi:hypothetical protein